MFPTAFIFVLVMYWSPQFCLANQTNSALSSARVQLRISPAEIRSSAVFECVIDGLNDVKSFQINYCKVDFLCATVYNVSALYTQGGFVIFDENQVNSTYLTRFSIPVLDLNAVSKTNGRMTIIVNLMRVAVADDGSKFRCAAQLGGGGRELSFESSMTQLRVFAPSLSPVIITWNDPVVEQEPLSIYCSANVGYPRGRIELVIGSPQQTDVVYQDESRTTMTYIVNADGTYFAQFVFIVLFNRTMQNIQVRCDAANNMPIAYENDSLSAEVQKGYRPLLNYVSSLPKGILVQHPPSKLYFRIVSSAARVSIVNPSSFSCPADLQSVRETPLEPSAFVQCVSDSQPIERVRWTRVLDTESTSVPSLVASSDGTTLVAPDEYRDEPVTLTYVCESTWKSVSRSVSMCASIRLRLVAEGSSPWSSDGSRNSNQGLSGFGVQHWQTPTTVVHDGTASISTLRVVLAVSGSMIGLLLSSVLLFSVRALRQRRTRSQRRILRTLTAAAHRAVSADSGDVEADLLINFRELDACEHSSDQTNQWPPAYEEAVGGVTASNQPPPYHECVNGAPR